MFNDPNFIVNPIGDTSNTFLGGIINKHSILNEIIIIHDFYKHISDNCYQFIPLGTSGFINYNSYIYESLAGTLSSINMLLQMGHLNDASVLLRLYFDNVLSTLYMDVLRHEKVNPFDHLYVEEVEEWIKEKHRIPSIKRVLKVLESSSLTKELYSYFDWNSTLK